MTTFPKKIVEKLQVVPGGVTSLVKKGESNFRPDVQPPQPPENPSGAMFEFSTHNGNDSELPTMLAVMPSDNSWAVIDADTGELLANSSGAVADGITVNTLPPEQQDPNHPVFMILFARNGGGVRKYKVSGPHQMLGIALIDVFNPGVEIIDGLVNVECFSNHVNRYTFSIVAADLRVPTTLPSHITDLSDMFTESNQFNQDLSRWNTSKVTGMASMFSGCVSFNQDIGGWNVGNVVNMDFMFDKASSFNQDLSDWCVKNIPRLPPNFDRDAYRWAMSRPAWGTCPGEEEVDPPYVPPVEEDVDKDTVIKAFDFAVIRYRWLPSSGTDLDTRTYLKVPDRSGRKVGWSRLGNDNEYLIWNEDNRGDGVESVLIDIDKIHIDYPGEQIIELKMDAFWYSEVKSGNLDIEFVTFKGGKMVATNYDWINEGGLAIQILKLGVDTLVQQSSDIEGENLATLRYDTLLKKGTLVARDGPSIGDGGTVEPEVPVIPPEGGGNGPGGIVDPTNPVYPDSEQGFTFSVEIFDNDGGAVPFEIRLVNVTPGWRVYSGNTLILSAEKIHPQVSANVAMGDVTLTFAIPRKDIKTYTIIAEARTLAFEVTQTSFSGQDIVINRFSNTILNHQFSVTDAILRVPTVLPSYITSTFNMFLGANQFNQDITMWDTSNVTNMSGMFDNAETFNQDISGWDVSNVTNMMFMFRYAHKFNQPIGSWNVKNVTNMKSMFESAPAFNQDLSKWCVSKIATKPDRFDYSAHSLYTSHLPVWGTCPVTYPPGIPLEFNLTTPDDSTQTAPLTFELEEWGTGWALYEDDVLISNSEIMGPGVSHSMGGFNRQIIKIDYDNFANKTVNYKMFVNNKHLNVSIDFNDSSDIYPTVEVLTFSDTCPQQSLRFAWTDMTVPTVLPRNINSTVTMFDGCQRFNQDITMWDTSNVTDMGFMFRNCISFNQDISGWDVSNVTDLTRMFSGASSFNQDISSWDVSQVKRIQGTFDGATVFNQDISGWNLASVMDYQNAFKNAIAFNQDISGWNTSNVLYMSQMFSGAHSFNQDISKWDVSQVQHMKEMFYDARSFNQDLSGWCVSNITSKPNLFSTGATAWTLPKPAWGTCPSTEPTPSGGTLKFSTHNIAVPSKRMKGSITLSGLSGEWQLLGGDTVLHSNVSTGNAVNHTVYLTDWFAHEPRFEFIGTASRVDIDLPNGFSGINPIGEVIIESFSNTVAHQTISAPASILIVPETLPPNITSTNKMFRYCSEFNQDISMWDTSNVTDMGFMFAGASSFNQDIGGWNVGKVTNMNSMFDNAKSFNQDLSSWNVSLIPSEPDSFAYSVGGWTLPKPVWGATGVVTTPFTIEIDNRAYADIKTFVVKVSRYREFVVKINDAVVYADGAVRGESSMSLEGNVRILYFGVPPSVVSTFVVEGTLDYFDISTNAYTNQSTIFNVLNFSDTISRYTLSVKGSLLTVPQKLSPAITSAYEMFLECTNFNQDIGDWDVSNITNMDRMFRWATNFNQDLSRWNVTRFASEPEHFSFAVPNWTLPKPRWGTDGTTPTGSKSFAFTTTNRMSSNPLPVALRVVSSGQAWSLIDVDTQAVIHEVAAGNTPGQTEVLYLDELGDGAERSYTIEGAASSVSLSINDEGRSDGFIKVESFSGDINQYKYDVKNADITVPLLLPSNVTNTDFMFQGCYNFNQDITGWDTSAITSMEGMFSGCTSFNQEIGNWDVSNVTNMNSMFKGCVIFNGDISSWETHALENMYAMFSDCEAFNQNLNDWDVSNVTDIGMLFSNCRVFNQPLDNWDTSSCVVFGSCFAGAHVFNQNINNWDVTNANDLNHVFSDARAFNQPLSNWVIPKLYTLESTFTNATSFNQDISNWNVSMVSDMSYMFQGATAFNKPLNSWDTSSLKYANGMFDGAHNFNQPLDNWTTSSLSRMSTMFSEATSFNQDLSSWCVTNFDVAPHNFSSGCLDWAESKPIWGTCDDEPARTFNFTFTSGSSVATGAKIRLLVRNLQGGWELYRNGVLVSSRTVTDTRVVATPSSYAGLAILIEPVASSVENYELKLTADALELGYTANDGNNHSLAVTQFSNGIAINEFALYKVALTVPETLPTYVKSLAGMFRGSDNFNQNINAWDVSHIKEFTECFKDCTKFNQPLDTWTMTGSSPVVSMFENCTAFNQDISSWDVTGKARLLKMFSGCTNFNRSLDAWDVSNVWSFESMFSQCSSLNQDFTNWAINTSTKVNMYSMFSGCTVFNGDITTWDMSMVGKTERMFTGCVAFNRDISGWNTASFTNMEYMFQNAISFNQDLSPWNVVKFRTMPYEFASNTPAWTLPKPVWGTAGTTVLA